MKILFIGTVVPEKYSVEIKSNSLAGNKFQSKIINELRKNYCLDVLSFVAVPLSEENKKQIDKFNDDNNRYFYKENNILKSILNYRKKLKQIVNNYDIVISYNVAYPWLGLPKMKKNKKSILLLADFSDSNSFNNIILKIYSKICKKDIRSYSTVVGLSENTERFLKNNQKFICIPGGIDLVDYKNVTSTPINSKIKIMYSGYLGSVTGVDLLLEAVSKIDSKDFELIITGRGELEKKIKNNNDKRIKFYGSIPYDEYLKLLNSANILVNPRNMYLPENNNNFPSKVLDYLAVGKVVVSTKFIGYEKFIDNFIFCDSTVDEIKCSLENAIKDYNKIYIKTFEKNIEKSKEYDWVKQAEKIISKGME